MGSLEDIPDVGNFHRTSVQVFIVRDSYLAKTTTRMGGLEGGRLEKGGNGASHLGKEDVYGCRVRPLVIPSCLLLLWGEEEPLRAGSIPHSGEHSS